MGGGVAERRVRCLGGLQFLSDADTLSNGEVPMTFTFSGEVLLGPHS